MSHRYADLDLDALRIAADQLNHKLNQMPRREQRPEAGPSTTPRGPNHAHIESAEEADQIYRDGALARQMNDEYNSSLFVNPSGSSSSMSRDGRPPRYSQVVHQPPEFPRWTRDDNMLGRQIQDQYHSSLFVEDADSRAARPPRYSQVFGSSSTDGRRDEGVARQIQDQHNSSLDVNVSRSRAEARDPTSKRRARSSDHAVRRAEATTRQRHEQRNSSLAVNQSSSASRPIPHKRMSFDDSSSPALFEHHGHDKPMLFDSLPLHQVPQRIEAHRPESYYHHPTYHGPVPLVGDDIHQPWGGPATRSKAKESRKNKKSQIRAKDHEHALRWLAGRRSLGGR